MSEQFTRERVLELLATPEDTRAVLRFAQSAGKRIATLGKREAEAATAKIVTAGHAAYAMSAAGLLVSDPVEGTDQRNGKGLARELGVSPSEISRYKKCGRAMDAIGIDPESDTFKALSQVGNTEVTKAIEAEDATEESVREAVSEFWNFDEGRKLTKAERGESTPDAPAVRKTASLQDLFAALDAMVTEVTDIAALEEWKHRTDALSTLIAAHAETLATAAHEAEVAKIAAAEAESAEAEVA